MDSRPALTPARRKASAATQRHYDRIASIYDLVLGLVEGRAFAPGRRLLWDRVSGGSILEVGVGTGRNMPYYPPGATVTAVDLSPRMLTRAALRARSLKLPVHLAWMTAEALAFPSQTFDWVVATFVFCSVPDAVAGLRELGRVCRPGGSILLLEHVRSDMPLVGPLLDFLNPLAVRVMGENINRRTVENVRLAGLFLVSVEGLDRLGLVKLIVARPGDHSG